MRHGAIRSQSVLLRVGACAVDVHVPREIDFCRTPGSVEVQQGGACSSAGLFCVEANAATHQCVLQLAGRTHMREQVPTLCLHPCGTADGGMAVCVD